ncbi:hypothetical protein QBC47DRAFT_361603 [Echria macrotheca]|uniref:CID domain-containing protein n=1 Tax=Echria macrotheca TaxID=438768 RepID=A0AAJ0BCI0_9PEZI|nr:hypothetical protein QBC47DRAFT_361603 [Echria macrotheca]
MADNAADVADDYREALEDLTMNSRVEIATLTNIARENAQHGLAITDVLTNHIKKVPPARTLPALYVLDSVVKNVPTPYALYFGPKLYSIFMGAYTKVDNATRRKMDEMLRTWKEPVPGSISTKPVFPPEHVRPIENALIAARNAAMAANQGSFPGQQQLLRGARPSGPPVRNTPTPPMGRPPSHQPVAHGQQPFPPPNGQNAPMEAHMAQQPYPIRPHNEAPVQHRSTPQPPLPVPPPVDPYARQPTPRDIYGAPQPPVISIEKLKADIQQLIAAEKTEFARNPLDTSKQKRLKALLDLQGLLEGQNHLSQDQLMLIKDKVSELAVNMRAGAGAPAPAVAAPVYTSTPTPPFAALPQQHYQPTPIPQVAVAPPPAPAVGGAGGAGLTLDALLGRGALATLLSGIPKPATPVAAGFSSSTPTPQPPQGVYSPAAGLAALRSPPPQVPAVQPPPPAVVPSPAASAGVAAPPPTQAPTPTATPSSALASNPSALLALLKQSGLIKPANGAGPSSPAPTAAAATSRAYHPPPTPLPPQFTPASLKHFRPHMTARLYESLGPPCTQCGRRFALTEEGRRKKTAHLDWHFRVHQRMAEYEKRGQYRSRFVDELDWIETPVVVDIDYVHPAGSSGDDHDASASGGAGGRDDTGVKEVKRGRHNRGRKGEEEEVRYIPVPDDSSRVGGMCPICQEPFEMKWLDEAQEWVWMDAVKIGERVYHWSCHREAAGDNFTQQGQGQRGGTPESVLGKRKAEDDDFQPFRGKLKMEGY